VTQDSLAEAYLLYAEIQRASDGHGGSCSGQVPVVLQYEAECLMVMNISKLQEIRELSLRWLATKRDGLIYEQIIGRPYTREEKRRLAADTENIRHSPCPMLVDGICILNTKPVSCLVVPQAIQSRIASLEALAESKSLCPHQYGPLPSFIAAKLDKQELISLVKEGVVPDAALALSHIP